MAAKKAPRGKAPSRKRPTPKKRAKKAPARKRATKKRTAKKATKGKVRKIQWDHETKLAVARKFVDFGDNLSKAARWGKVPISTLAGWLVHPLVVGEVEKYRKEHAREIARNRSSLVRETQAGMLEATGAHRLFVRAAMLDRKGRPIGKSDEDWSTGRAQREIESRGELFRQLPKHTRALATVHVIADKLARLDEGKATEHIGVLVGDQGLNDEIKRGLGDPDAMAILLKRRPDLLKQLVQDLDGD